MGIEESYQEVSRIDDPSILPFLDFEGWNYFTLVRFHLLLKFKDEKAYFAEKNRNPKITISHSLREKISFWLLKRRVVREIKNQFDKHRNSKIALTSSLRYCTDTKNNKKYNRHIDPFLELMAEMGINSLKFELQSENDFNQDDFFHSFEPFKYSDLFYYYDQTLEKSKWRSFAETAIKEVSDKCNIKFNQEKFVSDFINVQIWRRVYADLFSMLKLEHIGVVCFYEIDKLGLILAANENGIKVFDVQHGKQGKLHHLYYGWKNKAKENYLLPDTFWCWGDSSRDLINSNACFPSFPKAITGGNLWLASEYLVSKNQPNNNLKEIIKQKSEGKKIALFAIQPVLTNFQLDYIEESVSMFPEILFLVRMHPVMQKDKEIFRERLKNYSNVEFDLASDSKLFELLHLSDYCFSCWSTVLLEALSFGVISVVIHENGKRIFVEEINEKYLFFIDNPRYLNEFFSNSVSEHHRKIYFTDLDEIKKHFLEMLNGNN